MSTIIKQNKENGVGGKSKKVKKKQISLTHNDFWKGSLFVMAKK